MSFVPKFPPTAEKIYLQYNELTSIPSYAFRGLSNLEFLYLDHNKISSIEPFAFDGLTSLTYLAMRNNKLTLLGNNSLSRMPRLSQVYLTTNNIKLIADSSFNATESLEYVDFHANKLTSVPSLGFQPNLNVLMLEGNHIVDATFPASYKNCSRKMAIWLSNNDIKELTNVTFESLSGGSLTKLYLTKNDIKRIESGSLSCLNSIAFLTLSSNPLNSITLRTTLAGLAGKDVRSLDLSRIEFNGVLKKDTFSLMTNTTLSSLSLTFNKIRVISDGAFSKLNTLSVLNLSNNAINRIYDKAFKGLVQLSTLKLNDNYLATVPAFLPSTLNFLYLENNQIATIESNSFINQGNLRTLGLTSNRINQLRKDALNGLVNLKKLKMNNNNLYLLPEKIFSPLTRLQHLDISRNSLFIIFEAERGFSSLVALEYLNLAANECSFIQKDVFHAMRSLKYLHLESNNLGNLFSSDMNGELLQESKKLEELYIMNNKIKHLPESMLKSQYSLRVLKASHNKLSTWGSTLFRSTQKLSTLDLSYNLLSTLGEENLHDLNNLKFLDLTESPFLCNCDLRWFRDWINQTTTVLKNDGLYTCNGPSKWKGTHLLEFDRSKITCWFFTTYAIVGVALGTLLVTLLLVCLIYKNRWRIRLRWYRLSTRGRKFLKRSKSCDGSVNYGAIPNYTYDAYVSCSMPDREWALQHLLPGIDKGQLNNDTKFGGEFRLYYEDRDAEAGTKSKWLAMIRKSKKYAKIRN